MQASASCAPAAPSGPASYWSLANALTAVRLLLIVPFALLMASGEKHPAAFALVIYAVALATDFADGPMARRRGTVSAIGGAFDHTTDFLFVTAGLFAGASRDAFPLILPVLVVVAFAQYFIDSYWTHRRGGLRKSNLGRYNGILYFVPLCLEILILLGAQSLQLLLTVLVWLLVASTVVSIGQRLAFTLVSEKLPSSPPQK
jgi:CDP-diacylglycerol--glycerol-3-phosphate 3-phosphatidyltransferase